MGKGKKKAHVSKEAKENGSSSEDKKQGLGMPMTVAIAAMAMAATFRFAADTVGHGSGATPAVLKRSMADRVRDLIVEHAVVAPCNAEEFVAEVPVPGLHLICVEASDEESDAYLVTIYPSSRPTSQSSFLLSKTEDAFYELSRTLESELTILQNRTVNPWAIFTASGESIKTIKALLAAPTGFIFEGGSFIWPGVRVGYTQEVSLPINSGLDLSSVTMETLSMQPLIFSIDDFLTSEECDFIQENAGPHMKQSGVSLMDKDRGKKATEWRTSETYFMSSKMHAPLRLIDIRVSALTKVPKENQEFVQVLKYSEGQKYDAHHDYFDPTLYAKDAGTLAMTQHGKVNRMATVLWYLSDIEGGGETIFPMNGGGRTPANFASCDVGFKVAPKKGKVIMFYSLLPDGRLDKNSLHGACPVVGGDPKWAANKWVWNNDMSKHFETS